MTDMNRIERTKIQSMYGIYAANYEPTTGDGDAVACPRTIQTAQDYE